MSKTNSSGPRHGGTQESTKGACPSCNSVNIRPAVWQKWRCSTCGNRFDVPVAGNKAKPARYVGTPAPLSYRHQLLREALCKEDSVSGGIMKGRYYGK